MERMRVYHPETGEPFDVTVAKGSKLVLENGWSQQPVDPSAEPAVTEVRRPRVRRGKVEHEEDLGVPSGSWLDDADA